MDFRLGWTFLLELFRHDETPVHLLSCSSSTIAQLLRAETISLEWGTSGTILSPSGKPLPLTEPLSLEGGELTIQVNHAKQALPKPVGLLMVAIVHEDAFFVSMIAPGTFIFQLLWEHDLPTDLLFTSDTGTLLGPDCRLWSSLRLETLSKTRFPTIVAKGTLALIPPHRPHNTSAGGSSCGLDAFAVWAAMLDLTHATSCCVAHPQAVSEMLDGRRVIDDHFFDHTHHKSVALIFQIDHHWSLLFGVIDFKGIHWVYYDGSGHRSTDGAMRLGHRVAALLGLRSIAFDHQCHFSQQDDFTCGTIAILHLASALGLRGHLTSESLNRLHHLLCRRNHKTSWIFIDDTVSVATAVDNSSFTACGTIAETTLGLSNHTMWQTMKNLVGSADMGSRALIIAPFKFADQATAVTRTVSEFLIDRPFAGDEGVILAFIEYHGHWILMIGEPCGFPVCLTWTFFDGLCHLQSSAMRARLIAFVTDLSASWTCSWHVTCSHRG